jgi:hypothetical protein
MEIMKNSIFLLLILFYLASSVSSGQDSTKGEPRLFLINKNVLEKSKDLIRSGNEPPPVQYKELIRITTNLLAAKPHSVMEKNQIPPSGSKHDYMSIAPYWWPDADSGEGKPYIRKDGERNPEAKDYSDKDYFPETNKNIFNLSLAYYLSGEEKFAEKAVEFLRVWYLDDNTRMNPNLNFVQAIKGRNTGRGAGVLDGISIIYLIEALGLIDNSSSFTKQDRERIHQWFADYRTWLLESKNGKDESRAKNNHGSWYDVQMMSVSLYLGYKDFALQYAGRLKTLRIDFQIESDGRQPEELVRTMALHYSYFNLLPLSLFTSYAANLGLDYWNYVSTDGRSIRKALDYLYPFTIGGKSWPYKQITPLKTDVPISVLLYAYKFSGDKKYLDLAVKLDGHNLKKRFELLYMF